jgi:phage shock protein PspC (stress-responsive transcriptional regulator)
MRAVNTISLNGNAWQIEAEGYEALAAYLKSAETRLTGDPDRDEILADLEQAIADKLARRVNAHKNVVTVEEITLALQEMGPVEAGAAGPGAAAGAQGTTDTAAGGGADPHTDAAGAQGPQAPGATPAAAGAGATRHLFRIREGEMVGGVCNGLAAYFAFDVTVVRLIFVLASVFSGGVGAIVYIVMMMVVPVAETAEQMAAAHGKPFSAEELIGRPKGPQAGFAAGHHWRQQWRDQQRVWRDQRRAWRQQRRAWGFGPGAPYAPVPPPPPPFVGDPLMGALRWVLLIVFLVALVRAAEGRPVLGWDWAASVPHWVGIVAVCVIYGTLVKQTHMAQYYGHIGAYHPGHALFALIGAVIWLLVLACLGWYVVHHWPEVQDFLQRLVLAVQGLFYNGGSHNSIAT